MFQDPSAEQAQAAEDQDVTPNVGDDDAETAPAEGAEDGEQPESGWAADQPSAE